VKTVQASVGSTSSASSALICQLPGSVRLQGPRWPVQRTNGHIINGHLINVHLINGHLVNGHLPREWLYEVRMYIVCGYIVCGYIVCVLYVSVSVPLCTVDISVSVDQYLSRWVVVRGTAAGQSQRGAKRGAKRGAGREGSHSIHRLHHREGVVTQYSQAAPS
jgi:hypothetical protein